MKRAALCRAEHAPVFALNPDEKQAVGTMNWRSLTTAYLIRKKNPNLVPHF
jgi:hypothetical protein